MRELLYLIGPPGVGKTTALKAALEGVNRMHLTLPFAQTVYHTGTSALPLFTGTQIGGEREAFGGTDVLAMNVQPRVEEWLASTCSKVIVAEGDRLANDKFFHAVERTGWELTVLYFSAPWEVCQERREARAQAFATNLQHEGWLQGRHTKCEKLAATWCRREHFVDACAKPEWLVEALSCHSVIRRLRGE